MKAGSVIRTLGGQGRIVVPADFRKRLGLEKDDEIELYVEGNRLIVEKFDGDYEPAATLKSADAAERTTIRVVRARRKPE